MKKIGKNWDNLGQMFPTIAFQYSLSLFRNKGFLFHKISIFVSVLQPSPVFHWMSLWCLWEKEANDEKKKKKRKREIHTAWSSIFQTLIVLSASHVKSRVPLMSKDIA